MIKINERFSRYSVIGESDIYRKFSKQFDGLFNAEEIATDMEEFEEKYVHDYDFEDQIERFRRSPADVIQFCVGYTGIGKTTSIRHCFGLGVSKEAHISVSRKEVIFPTFLDGFQAQDMKNFNLTTRIAAVCTKLEEEHPELRDLLATVEGKKELYSFIRAHTAYALENINPIDAMDMKEDELIKEKLKCAYQENPYEFQANKLKFYIKKKYGEYERLVIILDDIESLPESNQQEIINMFLKLHECMKNTDYPKNKMYQIKLLISVRPHTYRIINNSRIAEAYTIKEPEIIKKESVDLDEIFKSRFDYYTKASSRLIGNYETWKDCYQELMVMNRAFDGKYKDMIKNLCFMNVREALASYSKIFANRFWVQKNKNKEEIFTIATPEYTFNNINVIRALSCGEECVFWGESTSIIPNIFYTTEDEDYSIYCLLIIFYFVKKRNGEVYGLNAEYLKDVIQEWNYIFGNAVVKKFVSALNFLFERKILRKSIKDFDDIETLDRKESLNENSMLYISPRGNEMKEMLGRDSVLLEMLRENAWRDYENRDYSEYSSYELMKECKQQTIFRDLLEYIDYLCEMEDDVIMNVRMLKTQYEYKKAFGNVSVTQLLLTGVKKSLEYSGMMTDSELLLRYADLRKKILSVTKDF